MSSPSQTNQPHKVNVFARFFFILGILLVIPVFLTPLWQINLTAPQYPEGLTMFIHYNNVTGLNEYDLENINLLNHYIGMKKIEAHSIPELVYMKYILSGLIVFGIIAFFFKRKSLMLAWVITAVLISAAGIYDLNRWEEEYGSELDPSAPIKVEGMTYKPPLIGEKELLNITATSYPYTGGIFFGFAIFVASMATFMAYRRPSHEIHQENHEHENNTGMISPSTKIISITKDEQYSDLDKKNQRTINRAVTFLPILIFLSCSVEPTPIHYNKDQCANCSMLITDSHYGSELVTKKGKAYKFDSGECLIWFLNKEDGVKSSDIHALLVTDYMNPGKLVDAEKSCFLISENLPSPMGANLTAFLNKSDCEKYKQDKGGEVHRWEDAQKILKEE